MISYIATTYGDEVESQTESLNTDIEDIDTEIIYFIDVADMHASSSVAVDIEKDDRMLEPPVANVHASSSVADVADRNVADEPAIIPRGSTSCWTAPCAMQSTMINNEKHSSQKKC